MKREFLKSLELEEETTNKIMSEYGKSISSEKVLLISKAVISWKKMAYGVLLAVAGYL